MKYIQLIIATLILTPTSLFSQQYNGWTLTSIQNAATATLMDTNKVTVKTWSGMNPTGYSTYLMPGGTLVRSATGATKPSGAPGGPTHGKIQKYDYAGTKTWDYLLSGNDYIAHHDICPMPNGNVLAIVYERKLASDVTAAGAQQNIQMWLEKIMEIKPTGATTGDVVWEWRVWDHLVQNVDPNKANYQSSIVDHPELLNVNYKQSSDWMHMNGIDYNPILDQIIVSSHNLNEWYVIDHSTTTAEAATHSGGNSGKGGDFLFRWGNPTAYGAAGTTILNVTHDAHWIPEGSPNAGRIVGFNNKGVASPSTSTIDYVTPPLNGYNYDRTPGQAYAPATFTDRDTCQGYSSNMGNSQQLPNGNVLICIATSGKVYEINSAGTTLWSQTFQGSIPQAFKYDSCYIFNTPPAIPTITGNANTLTSSSATTYQWYLNGQIIPGATSITYNPIVSGVYVVRITDANGCVYQYSKGFKYTKPNGIADIDLSKEIEVYPNPTSDELNIKESNLLGNQFEISIFNMEGKLICQKQNSYQISVSNLNQGIYMLRIKTENGIATKKIQIIK